MECCCDNRTIIKGLCNNSEIIIISEGRYSKIRIVTEYRGHIKGDSIPIKYCPMCGTKLQKGEV